MDEERIGPLGESAIDVEVAALFAAQPSPDFVARVRMQVASESFGHASFLSTWGKALALPAIAGVALIAAYAGTDFSRPIPAESTAHVGADVGLLTPTGQEDVVADFSRPVPSASAPADVTASRAPDPVVQANAPEIIISPREAEGLRYLLRAMQGGPATIAASDAEVNVLVPIELEPVTIDPPQIAAVASEEIVSD
jgi:hypothetical protein